MDVNLAEKGSFLESRQGHFLLILKRLSFLSPGFLLPSNRDRETRGSGPSVMTEPARE